MIATTLLLTLVTTLPAEDPPEKAPTPRAKPLTVYRWKSKNDLRFTWATPKGYDGKTPRNLTVICHGTGLDYRWGHWNNKPEVFRPDDIVVSVDGPSPGANSTRLFLGKSQDAKAMHAFLGELRQEFKIDRIFLYGHSQGGFFVVYYAGEYPGIGAGPRPASRSRRSRSRSCTARWIRSFRIDRASAAATSTPSSRFQCSTCGDCPATTTGPTACARARRSRSATA